MKTVVVTGGAGFIGSAVIRHLIAHTEYRVVNFDKLTYAGNLESLASVAGHPNYHFVQGDICDAAAVKSLFNDYQPQAIMHLAAESHVDRSIDGPQEFINTNIVGTAVLLEVSRAYAGENEGFITLPDIIVVNIPANREQQVGGKGPGRGRPDQE